MADGLETLNVNSINSQSVVSFTFWLLSQPLLEMEVGEKE